MSVREAPFTSPGANGTDPGELAGDLVICGFEGCDKTYEGAQAAQKMGAHRRSAHGVAAERPAARKRPARRKAAAPKADVAGAMAFWYMSMGQLMVMRGDPCGEAIMAAAPNCGDWWQEMAAHYPPLGRFLSASAGPSGALTLAYTGIMVHMPILVAVQAHHVGPAVAARKAAAEEAAQAAAEAGGEGFYVGGSAEQVATP